MLRTDGAFELRAYAPRVVAETTVDATLEDAGNQAFRKLFRYISGGNRGRSKIAMTAPVAQEADGKGWRVSFMMPSGSTLENLPVPEDPAVILRAIPAGTVASVRYSGIWSERRYRRHLRTLERWIEAQSLHAAGGPVWARYNPPFTPWFLRRNEVLVPVASPECPP